VGSHWKYIRWTSSERWEISANPEAIPEDVRTDHFTEYPFAWFGILCQAPPSHHELIYTRSEGRRRTPAAGPRSARPTSRRDPPWGRTGSTSAGRRPSGSVCRKAIPEDVRTDHFTEYPFAWFGILCQAPPSHHLQPGPDLLVRPVVGILRGVALEVHPLDVVRALGDQEGPIIDKTVLPFRSYVCEPLRHGSLVLVGDAGQYEKFCAFHTRSSAAPE
jgi:hypothetical protein